MAINIAPVLLPGTDPYVLKNSITIASIQGIIGDPAVPDFHLVQDPDANGIYGIAIISGPVAAVPVTTYYSTTGADAGATWHEITAADLATGALHLLADGNTYMKIVPDQDYIGSISYGSIVAWDGTNGIANGTYVPVAEARGGSTAYSTFVENPTMTVAEALTFQQLDAYSITMQEFHDFIFENVASPGVIFAASDKYNLTTSMLSQIVGDNSITSNDVAAYFQYNGYNSNVLDLSVSGYLAQYSVTVQQANDFIFANVASPETIYNVSKSIGLTADMLAEIVGGGFTGDDVDAYFTANGLNPVSMDLFATVTNGGSYYPGTGVSTSGGVDYEVFVTANNADVSAMLGDIVNTAFMINIFDTSSTQTIVGTNINDFFNWRGGNDTFDGAGGGGDWWNGGNDAVGFNINSTSSNSITIDSSTANIMILKDNNNILATLTKNQDGSLDIAYNGYTLHTTNIEVFRPSITPQDGSAGYNITIDLVGTQSGAYDAHF